MSEQEKEKEQEYVLFKHKKVRGGHGGVITVCLVGEPGGTWRLGRAWCSPSDQWDRKKGRVIAEGRARCPRTATEWCVESFHTMKDANEQLTRALHWVMVRMKPVCGQGPMGWAWE